MSIEKTLARNREKYQKGALERFKIVGPDDKQEELTDKFIVPYSDIIVSDALNLRNQVDKALKRDPDVRKRYKTNKARYPEGLCQEISKAVMARLEAEMQNRQYKGLQALKTFVRSGGFVEQIWGIDKNRYFQNAIQIGNSLLDVANDTVDRKKEPVVFYPNIQEAPIKPIETVEQFANIAESYWNWDIYPNIYLPWFSPVYPALALENISTKSGVGRRKLHLVSETQHLASQNLRTVRNDHLFGLSDDFLFRSHYSDKRLPTKVLDALLTQKDSTVRTLEKKRPDMFTISTDPSDARAMLERFHIPKKEERGIRGKYIDEMLDIFTAGSIVSKYSLTTIKI